ncbi:MAG: hypothetical protein BGO10_07715 [Chlamydia sp. 32-24]|nr:MAG: hypothetical protein BGO10_07715 [Chlamydia sp. 32-24]
MITIATVQTTPKVTLQNRMKQLENLLKDLDGVDFICLPEGFLTGYYDNITQAKQTALECKSALFQEWLSIFSKFNGVVIVGFNEIDNLQLFDSVAVIKAGNLLGIQRKHYIYYDYFTSGADFKCFKINNVSFGIVICRDSLFIEPSRIVALQGASILFSPMCNKVANTHPYSKRPNYYSHFVARSFENQCWFITADWYWPDDGKECCPGHTVIYNPSGQEICRSQENQEDRLIIRIPQDELISKKGLRVIGTNTLWQKCIKNDL